MIFFLADENFNRNIVRGLLRRTSQADITVAQDAGLTGADDKVLLAWAAQHGRIILTHDASTMVPRAYVRLAREEPMPGSPPDKYRAPGVTGD